MGTGFSKRKKQAKQMQEQLKQLQEEMKNAEATGTAGNGLVSITVNGEHQVTKVKIKPDCVDPDDIEGLEDLIRAAFNDASKKLQEQSPELDMSGLGGMGGIPGLGGLGGMGPSALPF